MLDYSLLPFKKSELRRTRIFPGRNFYTRLWPVNVLRKLRNDLQTKLTSNQYYYIMKIQ